MEHPPQIKKNIKNRFLSNIPPWILIGAVIILFPIFAFMTVNNINRQKENSLQLLFEKGAVLIKAFEAGTRTGMMMRGTNFQLQQLLTETAQQHDIKYLLVTDGTGKILAHNNPQNIGKYYGKDLNLGQIIKASDLKWRQISTNNKEKVFEVFSRFTPTGTSRNHGHMIRWQQFQPVSAMVIFIGLDMSPIESARLTDARHTIVMALILLLVGLSGIILLFLSHSYTVSQTSLFRIKAFSNNIVDNIPIGILTTDAEGKIVSLNNAAEDILCFSAKDIIGKNAKQILPKTLYRHVENQREEKRFIEEKIDCSIRNRKIPIELNTTTLTDEKGNFLGKVILLKDLSEISELRKEISRNQRLASLGRLASAVAHEIRNPLSSIKGFATYFKERYGKKAEDENVANIMIQEVERVNRVVSQLLEFSKPVAITKKLMPLKQFIEDSVKMIERQAEDKNIRIQTRYSLDRDKFLFDPDRLSQVLLNLYLNALESMDAGGELTIEAQKEENQKGFSISVSDTGTGISEQDLPNVFDPYFTTKPTGTGIGLAVVNNIIEAHNGNIHVSSIPGKGTRITIFLTDAERD